MRQKRWGSEENPFVLGLYPAIGGDREDALLSSKGCSSHLVCDTLRPSPKKIEVRSYTRIDLLHFYP